MHRRITQQPGCHIFDVSSGKAGADVLIMSRSRNLMPLKVGSHCSSLHLNMIFIAEMEGRK